MWLCQDALVIPWSAGRVVQEEGEAQDEILSWGASSDSTYPSWFCPAKEPGCYIFLVCFTGMLQVPQTGRACAGHNLCSHTAASWSCPFPTHHPTARWQTSLLTTVRHCLHMCWLICLAQTQHTTSTVPQSQQTGSVIKSVKEQQWAGLTYASLFGGRVNFMFTLVLFSANKRFLQRLLRRRWINSSSNRSCTPPTWCMLCCHQKACFWSFLDNWEGLQLFWVTLLEVSAPKDDTTAWRIWLYDFFVCL